MAIAFDSTSDRQTGTGTSLTFSKTNTGSNIMLMVGVVGDLTLDAITGVTYGGTPMTLVNKVQTPGARWNYLFYLANAATGANNVVVSASSSLAFIGAFAVSYTGVLKTTMDNSATATLASGTTFNIPETVIDANSWQVAIISSASRTLVAGTGTTLRDTAGQSQTFADSNGALTAGSHSLQVTTALSDSFGAVIASISPTATVANSNFFMFMPN